MFWMFIGFFRLNWQNFTCNKVFFSLVEEIKLANILEISGWFLGKHLFVCHSRLQQFKITAIGLKNCSKRAKFLPAGVRLVLKMRELTVYFWAKFRYSWFTKVLDFKRKYHFYADNTLARSQKDTLFSWKW